jgi:hypothetical protein
MNILFSIDSYKDIQIIIAIIAMFISVFAIYSKPRELVFDAIKWLITYMFQLFL